MGRWQPFPIVGGSYRDDALSWANQESINWMPIHAERQGTRAPGKLEMVPGMRLFAELPEGPHRGGRNVEGRAFVVAGTHLYQVESDGTYEVLGTIPGTGPVCMTHNQVDSGNQLVIGNRVSGYVWNTATETFTQITDEAFAGFASVEFLNQYVIGVDQTRRFWYHSELNDALSYNSLDRYQAETSPDRITGLVASHNEVLVFGERSIEPWVNEPTGNAAGTAFQLNRGAVIERGCPNGNTICKLDNSVFFLTDAGQVARLDGYTPNIISTRALEQEIAGCDWSKAYAFTWEDRGHAVYYLTFPDGKTFGWDVPQQEWHRRKSYGLDRWRLSSLFKWDNQWFGGDAYTGRFYRIDWTTALDNLDPIERYRRSGIVHDNANRMKLHAFRVEFDASGGPSVALPSDFPIDLSGDVGDAYIGDTVSVQYQGLGGLGGNVFEIVSGALPPGATMDAAGLVSGQYIGEGDGVAYHDYTWMVQVTDAGGQTATLEDGCRITNFSIAGNVLSGGIADTRTGAYVATHGLVPITYAVTSGTFPDGLTLASDGTYSGDFTTGDEYAWTITATDANGNTATCPDDCSVGLAGRFIATNGSGKFQKSTGTDWTSDAAFTTSGVTGDELMYGNGTLVIASVTIGQSRYSIDEAATVNTVVDASNAVQNTGRHGEYINGRFFGASGPSPCYSIDGETFHDLPSNLSASYSCIGGRNNCVIACGNLGYVITYSDDFSSFSQHDIGTFTAIGSNGSRICMVSNDGTAKYTDDGVNFSAGIATGLSGCVAITGYGINWVAVGDNQAAYSTDNCATWTTIVLQSNAAFTDVATDGTIFVVVGRETSMTELGLVVTAPVSDPSTWTNRTNNFGAEAITAVCWMGY